MIFNENLYNVILSLDFIIVNLKKNVLFIVFNSN